GGVDRACGLPPIALRGQHGAGRGAAPCPERPSISLTREEQGAQYEQQPKALTRLQNLTPGPPTCVRRVLTPGVPAGYASSPPVPLSLRERGNDAGPPERPSSTALQRSSPCFSDH